MRLLAALLTLAALLLGARPAAAHGMRAASVRVDQVSATRAVVRWTTTAPAGSARAVLPAGCEASPVEGEGAGGGDLRVWILDCAGGVGGTTFAVEGLGRGVDDATVFATLAGGRTASHLLTPEAPSWALPSGAQPALDVARSYVRAGLVHIATGADHLLLLGLLVLSLRRARAVLLAETAFTLSHSLSFAATALGWIHVPAAPAEACIALSLVLLALDAGTPRGADARRGAACALVFGVVHGLGFAGGLREAGLPDAHAAVALVGFGAGVELGQLAFLAAALAVTWAAARLRVLDRLTPFAATAAGGVATAWLLERTLAALGVA